MSNYKPENPSTYKGKQIIINSGRILFNANADSVMFFGKKSISFSSAGTINLDSDEYTVINAKKIYLGIHPNNEKPTEPLLLGNKTVEWLNDLVNGINNVSVALSNLKSLPIGAPYLDVNASAVELLEIINKLKINSNKLKSQNNYTI